jgi:nitrogen fixation protein NifU and related proteins
MPEGYSEITLDHYESPRNRGLLSQPDAVAELTNPVCGDQLNLSLRISNDTVEAAGFEVEGCVAAVAAASVMTELVNGRSLSEASAIGPDQIDSALGHLPAGRAHGAVLAAEALARAISGFQVSSTEPGR